MNDLFIYLFSYLCILSLASIAVIFTERAGIINLGINGVIVSGATTYMIIAYIFSKNSDENLSGWFNIVLFLCAGIGGFLYSSLHGLISIKLKGNQTISGIALNILAPAITLLILKLFGESNSMNYSVDRLELGNSKNGELISFISLKMTLTILIVIISFIFFTFTKWGLRFKSVGENPQAADAVGINVNKVKWLSILISGFIGGIAGAIFITEFSSGGTFKNQVNVEGLGFIAIAIVIISRWKALLSFIVSIIFSFLLSMGYHAKNLFVNGEKIEPILLMLPYLFTIFILIIFSKPFLASISKLFATLSKKINSKRKDKESKLAKGFEWCANKLLILSNSSQGPKSLGQPYDKSKR